MSDNFVDFAADRDNAIKWARELLADVGRVVILDTETTGLDSLAEVVQIGMIDLEGNVLIDQLCNPIMGIRWEASQVNGITPDIVKDAPSWEKVYPRVVELMKDKRVVIYNAQYDLRIMTQSSRVGKFSQASAYSFECAMLEYSAFVGEWNSYHGNYRWQRLPSGDHSAVGDCQATLKIIKKMAETKLSVEV